MSSEAQTIAELAVKANGAEMITTADGRQFIVLPEGHVAQDVTDARGIKPGKPSRIQQAVVLQTVDSLVEYVLRFRSDTTVLFADIANNSIAALIDYHAPDAAENVDHRATMALPFSEEWRFWTGISGKMFGQGEFARLLEENAPDVTAPTGAELLEVARDLQAVRKADFRRVVRTSGDDESFEYSEGTEAKTKSGTVEVPTKFQLTIPVYFGGASVNLFAFLRWKLDDGALTLGVALHRAEYVRQAVFQSIVQDAAERTERPAVFGRAS